jgi:diguanylate cyclase (GGDEF)-like protein/PAS domain S-box-containing protein
MRHRIAFKQGVMTILLCILFLKDFSSIAVFAEEDIPPTRILILNSYSDNQWTESLYSGILEALEEYEDEYITYTEYLDFKRFPDQDYQAMVRELLEVKYQKINIDIIITTDDHALEFGLMNRKELLSDAPIVFTGVHKDVADVIMQSNDRITGVYEEVDAKTTLYYATQINPELKKVYLISEMTQTAQITEQMIVDDIKAIAPHIVIESLSNNSMKEIVELVDHLPNDSILLMGAYSIDKSNKHYGGTNLANIISNHSTVPLYVLYNYEFGTGALGGQLLMGEFQGQLAGQMALKIIHGADIKEIKPLLKDSYQPTFDYEAIKKYDISLKQLPKKAVIINRKIGFVERYRTGVIIVSCIITFLMFAVTILIINIRKRIKAEKILLGKNAEIQQLYDTVSISEEELQAQFDELWNIKNHLSMSEERYRLVAEASNDIIWDLDLNSNTIYFPERLYYELELPQIKASMEWDEFLSLINIEDLEDFKLHISKHLEGKTYNLDTEVRIRVLDGTYRWFSIHAKAIRDNTDKLLRMTGCFTDITEKKHNLQMIENLAFFDPLTGMHNRTGFLQAIHQVHMESEACGGRYAILYIDLDNFKELNDTFGHSFGDQVLEQIAGKYQELCDKNSIVARLGGDEFIMIMKNADNKQIEERVTKLLKVSCGKLIVSDKIIYPSASIGVSIFPDHAREYETLIRYADIAMYGAKKEGKMRYKVFTNTLFYHMESKVRLADDIRIAIEQRQFIVYYQPQVDTVTGAINHAEALIRWNHPERGMISPMEFIPLAEETGQIIQIGFYVLGEVLAFKRKMNLVGKGSFAIAVNVSLKQLMEKDFVERFSLLVAQSDIGQDQIIVEITESIFSESFEDIIECLNQLREKGFQIALDDFGTGYSSLSYLLRLPIHTLKIDKSFIKRISMGGMSRSLINSIIEIAHNLGLKVVAEGVEEKNELDFLKEHNCDYIQGYYFSKPLPEEEFIKKITEEQ